jgi:hypothetical protein
MTDKKISALTDLGGAPASTDVLPIVDSSANQTKKVSVEDLFTNPDVTGTLTVDGTTVNSLTVNTNVNGAQLKFNDGTVSTQPWSVGIKNDGSNDFLIYSLGAENVQIYTADKLRQQVGSGGDISFYEDTGTTAKFFWDASAESLGIGTASPAWRVEIDNGADSELIQLVRGAGNGYIALGVDGSDAILTGGTAGAAEARNLVFRTANASGVESEAMRIDSSGNVGIGTTSPAAKLEIGGAGEGIILASPDGTRYEITVANGGTLTVTAV